MRALGWGIGGSIAAVAFGGSWIGLSIALIGLMAVGADWIGQYPWVITGYIVLTIMAAYLIPLGMAVTSWLDKDGMAKPVHAVGSLVAGLMMASVITAIPSSLIANGGCDQGQENAYWAMRSIPVLAIADRLVPSGLGIDSCSSF